MSVSKLEGKTGAKIMAICDREGVKTRPKPGQTLEPGCMIFALGDKNQIKKLEEAVEEKQT
jgi:K+/H+ antiporter YhaU regulatory subunit KhtT